uniref:Nucleolar protein 14 n=1 Tax=Anopheles christyi TaxID=43041 RepID=A0A182K6H3_9DIPT
MCAKVSKKADAVMRRKATANVRKANPFETVVMKTKHAVLNRGSQSKRPGKLQRMSFEKRQQTLGKEFALLHKTNRFMDARVNGKYARQPSNKAQAKEMYNLNLTHGGRTMHEIENFDDVPDGADEDEDEDGMLQDSFTSATHFGGGSDDESRPGGKDRKTVIEEMIAESKRQKTERQRENDEVYEMRLKLDDELKSLMPQFSEHIRKDNERPKPDDYDRVMREMVFEPRGAPTEKLKSIDLAAAEQKRRETAEREKQERMQRDAQKATNTNRPISADALSDEYLVEGDIGEVDGEADAYYGEANGDDAHNGLKEDDENGEEEDEDSGEESESSDADSLSDLKAAVKHESEEESESEAEPEPVKEAAPKAKPAVKGKSEESKAYVAPTFELRMIDVPREYDQFFELLDGSVHDRVGVIASMIHTLKQKPFLHKSRWSVLFAYALNYLGDRFTNATSSTIGDEFQALHLLTPFLHDIAQTDPAGIGKVFHSVVEEKYTEFKNHPRRYPDLATLVLLKLVPLLFSASDRRHSIVTPALVFMGEILTRCQVRNRRDVARGLLLVTTVLECVEHSKRFLPSAVSFLTGVLNKACVTDALQPLTTIGQPFKRAASLLLSDEDDLTEANETSLQLTGQDLLLTQITPSFKVRAIGCSISLLAALCTQSDNSPAVSIIAKHFLHLLNIIHKGKNLPAPVQSTLEQTIAKLTELAGRKLPYLVQAAKKPKPLRLLEPKINPVYEDIRRRPKTAVPLREQRRKMQQKIKKVTRGAKREIRLDNEYLAKLQHKRRMESDRERQQKVRQIFSHASNQQAELKSLDRRAKYRK